MWIFFKIIVFFCVIYVLVVNFDFLNDLTILASLYYEEYEDLIYKVFLVAAGTALLVGFFW
jgi:hypothetical protein